MADFSHWDFAEEFDAWDAAALILGIEPTESHGDEARVRVVWQRMRDDFVRGRYRCLSDHYNGPPFFSAGTYLKSIAVVRLENWARLKAKGNLELDLDLPFWWSDHPEDQKFENQRFSRSNLVSWLGEVGQRSVYDFAGKHHAPAPPQEFGGDLDPADYPQELQAANIAFRAVSNGYGDANATFKNRLTAYLEAHFVDLGAEAVKRIATVANADKEPGRRRRGPE